jgi:hypothetical protein
MGDKHKTWQVMLLVGLVCRGDDGLVKVGRDEPFAYRAGERLETTIGDPNGEPTDSYLPPPCPHNESAHIAAFSCVLDVPAFCIHWNA